MKKLIIIAAAASLFTACGIYKPYTRPELSTGDLYGKEYAAADTSSLADIGWRELFADRHLQRLIDITQTCRSHGCGLPKLKLR